jgi:hypothetical protein
MSTTLKGLLITVASILILFIFIRPPVVRMYCENYKDTQSRRLLDDLATQQIKELTTYNQNNLSMGDETVKARDMAILNKKYNDELKQDEELVNQWYEDCLHRWGD